MAVVARSGPGNVRHEIHRSDASTVRDVLFPSNCVTIRPKTPISGVSVYMPGEKLAANGSGGRKAQRFENM
jgi:hypothetical protein